MSLSASVLSAAIKANRLAKNPGGNVVDNAALQDDCDAIAAAVVAHITSAGVVIPTALEAPSGGGPVTGVGSIT
jgi:hypothetical protein